ncbi:MAG TPA: BatD family protein [Polyangia bacterium]|nr:BatD family protein [Polyangia bacterium]
MNPARWAFAALLAFPSASASASASEPASPSPSASASASATADAGAAAAPDPDAPTVTARVDKAEAHVGDAINLTVTAIGRRGVAVNLPSTIALDPFTVLDRKEAEQDLGDGKLRREFILMIAAYEPGEVEIPPVEVTYLGKRGEVRSARTTPVAIKIASLIANEPEPALKDIAPPVAVRQQDLLLAYIAAGLLAAAIGALVTWLVVRRLRGRALHRPGPPPRPAHEIALEKLDRLGAYGFLENADNRPFYFAVSEVIREYLGARFGFDSLELTTDELVAQLRRSAGRELIMGEVQGWLSTCDLVKFAKISPSASEARGTLETAILIVSSTRPRVEVVPVAGAAAAAPGTGDASAGGRP